MERLLLVHPEGAEAGTIETLPKTEGMALVQEHTFLESYEGWVEVNKVCITSEATLTTVLDSLADETKISAIKSMKDKYLFRQLLAEIYPKLAYEIVDFDAISNLKITGKKVLKPAKGCFGTAVKIIDENSNLAQITQEIKAEIDRNASVLSDSVLSKNKFILEDYIEGEEYAVDIFYDALGEPHVVGIYYHPIPANEAYLHMIYYTNKAIFDKVYDQAKAFFAQLNVKLQLKNTALHAEFKLAQTLIPIEINAMRFGGMGLGNMIYYSLNVNPYQYFIEEKSPDWRKIWEKHPEGNFVFFIAYNGTHIDKSKQQPNLDKLEGEFTKILNKTIFDYQKQLAFGVYTLAESTENIEKLLKIDFNECFKETK
ncbi:MAG: ATP-grasp domain-containing protein [Thermonemataceae bacterium]